MTDGLHCLMQHFVAFYEQCSLGKKADFGEPCEKCQCVRECNLDWLEKIMPFCESTGIHIKLARSGHPEKQDNVHTHPDGNIL